jgi:hypothetical protein
MSVVAVQSSLLDCMLSILLAIVAVRWNVLRVNQSAVLWVLVRTWQNGSIFSSTNVVTLSGSLLRKIERILVSSQLWEWLTIFLPMAWNLQRIHKGKNELFFYQICL